MSEKLIVSREKLDSLAEVIASKSESDVPLTFEGMEDAVLSIETGIEPTGTISITKNGIHDVTEYANAEVNVQPKLQEKFAIPRLSDVVISPSEGYDGLSRVTISRINLGSASVTPSTEQQVVTAADSTAYNAQGLSSVTVEPIPSQYLIPSGSQSISIDGTYDVHDKYYVDVDTMPTIDNVINEYGLEAVIN